MARLEDVAFAPIEWSVVHAPAANTAAIATKAAAALTQHYVQGISVSFSAAPAAALTVQLFDGTTPVDQFLVPAGAQSPLPFNYSKPFRISVGSKAELQIPAAGAGVSAVAVIKGFSRVN
jgi:hypothetical protein